jgi:hypothetical protein
MTWAIFRIILSLSVVIYSLVYLFQLKRRKDKLISWNVTKGEYCYGCKEFIKEIDINDLVKNISDLNERDKETFNLCQCCKRDESLNGLLHKHLFFSINNFKKFCYSKKSNKVVYLNLLGLFFLVLDIFLATNNETRFFFYMWYITMVSICTFNTYKCRLIYKKENPQ